MWQAGGGDAGLRMAAVALLYALRNGTRPLADGDLSQRGAPCVSFFSYDQ